MVYSNDGLLALMEHGRTYLFHVYYPQKFPRVYVVWRPIDIFPAESPITYPLLPCRYSNPDNS